MSNILLIRNHSSGTGGSVAGGSVAGGATVAVGASGSAGASGDRAGELAPTRPSPSAPTTLLDAPTDSVTLAEASPLLDAAPWAPANTSVTSYTPGSTT